MGNALKIHTQMGPSPAGQASPARREKKTKWRAAFPAKWKPAAVGDRLLRSTAVACALLLGVMALRNAQLSWAQRAVEGVEKVMTMKIDLDSSLGKLRFVRELVPETALVFWNASSPSTLTSPVQGQIEHPWSEAQPWRIYACADSAEVCAAMDGEVKQVEKGAMADYIVLITHDNGMETVYAYLADVHVNPGERVWAGDAVGAVSAGGGARLYFALRQDGAEIDPEQWED